MSDGAAVDQSIAPLPSRASWTLPEYPTPVPRGALFWMSAENPPDAFSVSVGDSPEGLADEHPYARRTPGTGATPPA